MTSEIQLAAMHAWDQWEAEYPHIVAAMERADPMFPGCLKSAYMLGFGSGVGWGMKVSEANLETAIKGALQ